MLTFHFQENQWLLISKWNKRKKQGARSCGRPQSPSVSAGDVGLRVSTVTFPAGAASKQRERGLRRGGKKAAPGRGRQPTGAASENPVPARGPEGLLQIWRASLDAEWGGVGPRPEDAAEDPDKGRASTLPSVIPPPPFPVCSCLQRCGRWRLRGDMPQWTFMTWS